MTANRAKKIGLPPGTLIHVGTRHSDTSLLTLIDYNPDHHDRIDGVDLATCLARRDQPSVTWVNLAGIHDVALVEELGTAFGIHPLALEDILNTDHRPKIETFDSYLLIILKMLHYDTATEKLQAEQVSIVMGHGFVLSFQEKPEDVFDGVRERLRNASGRIRSRGADYLAYALMDSVVDSYFHILEKVGDRLVDLEDSLTETPDRSCLQTIHHFKRELISLRKSIWPLREVVSGMQRDETHLIDAGTGMFLRDLYDHTIQVIDTTEIYRDTLSGLLDLYLSSISNRMNEVMKVLTIMATLFIPLTFIAGIYGMNFEYMPELKWRWGYPMFWLAIFSCATGMFVFFRRKKWL